MIFFHLSSTWLSDHKKLLFLLIHSSWKTEIRFFPITEPCRFYLQLRFLIKSGYHIVPSSSTALPFRCNVSICDYGKSCKVIPMYPVFSTLEGKEGKNLCKFIRSPFKIRLPSHTFKLESISGNWPKIDFQIFFVS